MNLPAVDGYVGPSADLQDALLSSPLLGGGLPPEAERHLERAALSYHHSDVAETHLQAADLLAPDHAAVLIAYYRFYFYKGRLVEALAVARTCLCKAMRDNGIGDDWRAVKADDANFTDWGALVPRFFLFTLKGYAYLNMRLGRLEEGRAAAEKLIELDARDRIGAQVLLDVLDRMGMDDDD
jgi:tetratricopeptide (TPR) repeat protein